MPGTNAQRDVVGGVALGVAKWAHDRERGHQVSAFVFHELQGAIVYVCPVLDTAHAGAHRGFRPHFRVGVGGNELPVRGGRAHRRFDLLFGELLPPRLGRGQAGTLTRPDFDHVGPPIEQRSHYRGDVLGAGEPLVQVPPELRKRRNEELPKYRPHDPAGTQELRSAHVATSDQVARAHTSQIPVAGHTRRGDAREERARGRLGREDVCVRVDEPRKDETTLQVDDLAAVT